MSSTRMIGLTPSKRGADFLAAALAMGNVLEKKFGATGFNDARMQAESHQHAATLM
jgi:hypothetical protein